MFGTLSKLHNRFSGAETMQIAMGAIHSYELTVAKDYLYSFSGCFIQSAHGALYILSKG